MQNAPGGMPARGPAPAASHSHTSRFGPPVANAPNPLPVRSGFNNTASQQQRAAGPMHAPASQRPMPGGGGRRGGFRSEPLDDDIAAARTARPMAAPPVYPPSAPPVARGGPPQMSRDRDIDRRAPARIPREPLPPRDRDGHRGRDAPRGRDRDAAPRSLPDRAPPRAAPERGFSPARAPARPPADRHPPARPSASGGPRYTVKVPAQAVYVRERALQYVAAQHDKMYVPSEFMRSVALWQDLFAGPQRLTLDAPVQFEVVEVEAKPPPAPPPEEPEASAENGVAAAAGDGETKCADDAAEPPVADAAGAAEKVEEASMEGPAVSEGEGVDAAAVVKEEAATVVKEEAAAVADGVAEVEGAAAAAEGAAAVPEEAAVSGGQDVEMRDGEEEEENGAKVEGEASAEKVEETSTGADNGSKRGSAQSADAAPAGRSRASSRKSAPAAVGRKGSENSSAKMWMRCTVVQLRAELSSRRLSAKGVKADLVARLAEDDTTKDAAASSAEEEDEEAQEEKASEGVGEEQDGGVATAVVTEEGKEDVRMEDAEADAPAEETQAEAKADVVAGGEDKGDEGGKVKSEQEVSPLKRRPPPGVRAKAEAAAAEAAAVEAAAKVAAAAQEAAGPHGPGTRWSAKVLIIGGISSKVLGAPTSRTFKHHLEVPVLVRRRPKGEVMLLGGPWAAEDGGHPAEDPSVLLRTAARHVRQQAGVDVSRVGLWTRLLEVQFRRPDDEEAPPGTDRGHVQRTVVYVVNAADVAEPNTPALAEMRAAEVRHAAGGASAVCAPAVDVRACRCGIVAWWIVRLCGRTDGGPRPAVLGSFVPDVRAGSADVIGLARRHGGLCW